MDKHAKLMEMSRHLSLLAQEAASLNEVRVSDLLIEALHEVRKRCAGIEQERSFLSRADDGDDDYSCGR